MTSPDSDPRPAFDFDDDEEPSEESTADRLVEENNGNRLNYAQQQWNGNRLEADAVEDAVDTSFAEYEARYDALYNWNGYFRLRDAIVKALFD